MYRNERALRNSAASPDTAREFVITFADRILFGTDLLPDVDR